MEIKQYNLDYLKSISGGDQEFIIDMINTFIADVPKELTRIRTFIINENWQKVGEDAHKFASSLLFLGLNDLRMMATQIEDFGLAKKQLDQIPMLFEQLEKGCYQIIVELKQDFNM